MPHLLYAREHLYAYSWQCVYTVRFKNNFQAIASRRKAMVFVRDSDEIVKVCLYEPHSGSAI
jgi:hypothetical protein